VALSEEVLKKVRLLDISTRKLVNNLLAGEYHTAFKGSGMTFADFREYVAGDDVRSISWTLMARTGKPYIKRFDEERELTLMLAVDVSGSGDYGSGPYLKSEIMAFIAAALGFSAARNNDRIGLLLFTDRVELFVPPKKGKAHVQRILSEIISFQPNHRGTSLEVAIDQLMQGLKKKSTIFILSDFYDKEFERPLRQLGQKHDAIAVLVQDPTENEIPSMGLVSFHDAESGEQVVVDTSDSLFRKHFKEQTEKMSKQREAQLRKSRVDIVKIDNGEKFIDPLLGYFRNKNRLRR